MIIDIEKESIYCNSFDQYEAQVRKNIRFEIC